MSAKGAPVENAFAESFMGSLKVEEIYMWDYETYADVIERIPYFIEEVYNREKALEVVNASIEDYNEEFGEE